MSFQDRLYGLHRQATALAACSVGTWTRDAETRLVYGDPTYAMMYGFTAGEASRGIPHGQVKERIHPDDQELYVGRMTRARRAGGLMVLQYRVIAAPGDVRLILARGQYDPVRPDGRAGGARGIAIDVTNEMPERASDRIAFVARVSDPDDHQLEPLHRAADHMVAFHRELEAMPEVEAETLRSTSDRLLLLLARLLARQLPTGWPTNDP